MRNQSPQNSASTPASPQPPDGLCTACPLHRLKAQLAHELCTYRALIHFLEKRDESLAQDLLALSSESEFPDGPPEEIEPFPEERAENPPADRPPVLDQLIIMEKEGEPPRIWAAVELNNLPKMRQALLLILAADALDGSDGDGGSAGNIASADPPGSDELVSWKTKAYIEQHLPASARANPGTRKPNAVRMLVKHLRDEFQKRGLSRDFIECKSGSTMDDSLARLRVRRAGSGGAGGSSCDDSKRA